MSTRKPLFIILAVLLCFAIPSGLAVSQEETPPVESTEIQSADIPAGEEPAPPAPGEEAVTPDEEDQTLPAKKAAKSKKAAASQQTLAQTTADGAEGADSPDQEQGLQKIPVPDAFIYTGAAVYKVPIKVPAGRNGLAPSIALTYNSMRGNSWVGVGWDLDLGSIRRSTKRGLDYSADDYVYESTDSSEELVSASSSWGANFYQAKVQENFTKYFYNGTNGWTVTAKDGTKYYYGSTSASRQEFVSGVTTNTYQWRLDKIEDTNGNYLEITYTNDQGELYPNEIKYTGHNLGLLPTNSAKFVLEDRTDVRNSYATESLIVTAKRLKAVEIYSNSQLVRKYVIEHAYSPNTDRSLVQSVTSYGSDGTTSLPATSFQYQDGGTVITYTDPVIQNNLKAPQSITDINSDGLGDLVYFGFDKYFPRINISYRLSQGNGIFGPAQGKQINPGTLLKRHDDDPNADAPVIGDINADGKLDVIIGGYANESKTQRRIITYLGLGDLNFSDPIIQNNLGAPRGITDVNADGLGDLVYYSAKINDKLYFSYRLSLGNGQFGSAVSRAITLGKMFAFKGKMEQQCEDVENGDHGSHTVCKYVETKEIEPAYELKIFLGDVNGDGELDLILGGMANREGPARIMLLLGNGANDFNKPIVIDGISAPASLVDINGDGLDDLVSHGISDGGLKLSLGYRLSLGNGQFGSSVSKKINLGNFGIGLTTHIGEISGDGKSDFIVIGRTNDYHETPRGAALLTSGPAPDLLVGLSNGYGGSVGLQYAPSTQYVNTALPFAVQTVSGVTSNDGLGNQTVTTYTYSGGFYDFSEREFRGFSQAKKTNPDLTTEETWFHQDKYFQGRAYQSEFRDPAATLLSKSILTWNTEELSSGVTFVKLDQKHSESYDAEMVFTREDYTYDNQNGNLLTTVTQGTDGEKTTQTNQYGNFGEWIWRLTKTTLINSAGTAIRESYNTYENATGNLSAKSSWLQGGTNPVIFMTYDPYGNVETVTDARGNQTSTDYDPETQTYPIKVTMPKTGDIAHVTETKWNPLFGRPEWTKDENNNITTRYYYDVFGRLVLTENLDNGRTEITYSDVTDIEAYPRYILTRVKEDTAGNMIDKYEFMDGFGRSIQVTTFGENNKPIVSRTYYDNMGRIAKAEGPFFASGLAYPQAEPAQYPYLVTEYDYRGRPIKIQSPHGDYPDELITTSLAYQGFTTTVTDPDGNRKTEKKDYLGRVIEITEYPHDNEEYHTSYHYNAAGDLLKVTDALNNQTTLVYDTLGRKRAMTDPDMGYWTYEYDLNSNLWKQFDAKGQEIRFEYDALNRVLSKTSYAVGPQSPVIGQVLYTYDNPAVGANGIGKPYQVIKSGVTITNNTYDAMGRILKVTKTIDNADYVTENEYDLSGKVIKLIYPNNTDTTEVKNEYYPGTNLLKQVIVNNVLMALYTDYEPSGKIGQIDYQNGTATKYTYDAWSQKLFGIVTAGPNGDLQDRSYTYSRAGDIIKIQDDVKGITYDYTYDKLHRLISEKLSGSGTPGATKVETITLDYAGTGPVHGPKTITLNGTSRACQYDANGNMVTSPDFTNAANPLNRSITYDADNMPVRIAHANGATVDFVYDSTAKRTKKLVQGGKTVLYIGDHYEVENNVAIKYIFGGNLRLSQIKGSLTSYFHKDHLGSTAAVTDESGQKKESTTYEPFGATRSQEGTIVSAYKFTDQEADVETGLYNYDARLYDPVLGMFVTPDSLIPNFIDLRNGRVFNPQSLNRFVYCRNNPLIYVDPTGHVDVVGPDEHGGQITTHDGTNLIDSTGKSVDEHGNTIDKDAKNSGSGWRYSQPGGLTIYGGLDDFDVPPGRICGPTFLGTFKDDSMVPPGTTCNGSDLYGKDVMDEFFNGIPSPGNPVKGGTYPPEFDNPVGRDVYDDLYKGPLYWD